MIHRDVYDTAARRVTNYHPKPYPDLQLPSLPEVTLKAMEACRQDNNYRQISAVIAMDTGLVTRVLALANSSIYGRAGEIHSVEQALLRLGTDQIQTLILTASLRQILFDLAADQWRQLRDFWRHSLTTALMARALATLTRYARPEEAFMLGLLHNVGELIALKTEDEIRRQHYLSHHAEIAAELVLSWGLGDMASDAMRYQQAAPDDIQDASHLVKLICLSTRLALSDAAGLSAAVSVFDLSEELTREIMLRIDREVESMAQSLNIPLDSDYDGKPAMQSLQTSLIQQAQINQAMAGTGHPGTQSRDILRSAAGSLTLLTGLPVLSFVASGSDLALVARSHGQLPDLSVATSPARGALTRAVTESRIVGIEGPTASILDRQLLNLLGTPAMVAIPIPSGVRCPGVLVIGTETPAPPILELARMFTEALGRQLEASQSQGDQDQQLQAELAHQQLRRQVHEINNPLTIIRQYLYQLRNRMSEPQTLEDLDVIREELDRAGKLLLGLSSRDRAEAPEEETPASVNDEVRSLAELFEDGLFAGNADRQRLELCSSPTKVAASGAKVRQLLINLVKNAAEASPDEGTVTIQTAAPVWQNGRPWIELVIEDDGPGLPSTVQQQLFQPVESTKGQGHSGLGLSIVKQLTDDMEGIISCRTGESGTVFRILLPAIVNEPDN